MSSAACELLDVVVVAAGLAVADYSVEHFAAFVAAELGAELVVRLVAAVEHVCGRPFAADVVVVVVAAAAAAAAAVVVVVVAAAAAAAGVPLLRDSRSVAVAANVEAN